MISDELLAEVRAHLARKKDELRAQLNEELRAFFDRQVQELERDTLAHSQAAIRDFERSMAESAERGWPSAEARQRYESSITEELRSTLAWHERTFSDFAKSLGR